MDRLLIALDVGSMEEALAAADRLRGSVGGFKIGKQLFTAAGPEIVRALVARGDRIFLDLKFHDIPNTVAGAVRSAAALGAWMVNVHASGGEAMMAAAREAADTAVRPTGLPRPLVVAVTVLTSLDADALATIGVSATPEEHVLRLARLAKQAGLDGVVASARETAAIREACGPDFVIVTPGIRGGAAASGPDDQRRTTTPRDAVDAGSSYLVVGRPVTAAAEPRDVACAIVAEIGSPR